MLDKGRLRKKIINASLILGVIFLVLFSGKTLSKYVTDVSGSSKTRVAKWQNDIQLLQDDEFIIDSEKGTSTNFKFKVLSSSEVSSKYDLTFKNVPFGLGITVKSDTHSRKVFIDNNVITVSFDGVVAVFDKNTNSTINNINYALLKETEKETMIFDNQTDNTSIAVEIINNSQNFVFYNFDELAPGNNSKEHTCIFEVLEEEFLISTSDIVTYATFEQID